MRRVWHNHLLKSALVSGLLCCVVSVSIAPTVRAEDSAPHRPNWPSSEYHGKIDGNGNPIPCRCLFRGQSLKLGTKVCMSTHKGTVIAECDLVQNNTSWVPTDQPCTISGLKTPLDFAQQNYPLNKPGSSTN